MKCWSRLGYDIEMERLKFHSRTRWNAVVLIFSCAFRVCNWSVVLGCVCSRSRLKLQYFVLLPSNRSPYSEFRVRFSQQTKSVFGRMKFNGSLTLRSHEDLINLKPNMLF